MVLANGIVPITCMPFCTSTFPKPRVSAYLSSSVPQLQANSSVLKIHGFAQEVNANRGLISVVERIVHESEYRPDEHEYLRNSAPRADLVIRLVFPTLWSPSNTILVRFGGVEEKSAVAGVDSVSITSVLVCRVGGFQVVAHVGPSRYEVVSTCERFTLVWKCVVYVINATCTFLLRV